MKKRIVVKVGTNVLTRKNQLLDYNRISDLVRQIAQLHTEYEVILVSSGAQGAGKEFFSFDNVKDPVIRKQMLASIGQGRLLQVYSDFFREHNINIAQALMTRDDFHSEISYLSIQSTLEGLLENGVIPIVNENDVVSSLECSFGDNDQLASLTAALMEADLLVILSDIMGFYTADPKNDPEARLIPVVEKIDSELRSYCEDTMSSGGTGGMYSKLRAAELSTQHGIPTVITYGKADNTLLKAVRGEAGGTRFLAKNKKKLSFHGRWMNSGAHIKGTITIDAGARKALIEDKKSLLAVGVISVKGDFDKKDVVLVRDHENIRLGTGLAGYSSEELGSILAEKERQGKIVVHRNHLYTL